MAADVEVRWYRPISDTGKTEWQTVWLDAVDYEGLSADAVASAIAATTPGDRWETIDMDMAQQKIMELLG